MKKLLVIPAVLSAVFLAGCGKSNAPKTSPAASASQQSQPTQTPQQTAFTGAAAQYEAALLNLAKCEMKNDEPESKCYSDVMKSVKDMKLTAEERKAVITKLYKSENPAVRGYAIGYYDSLQNLGAQAGAALNALSKGTLKSAADAGKALSKSTNANVSEVVEIMKTEKDPYVLSRGIDAMRNQLRHNDDLVKIVKDATKNPSAKVRKSAVLALGNTWSKDVAGAGEALVPLLSDKEKEVRQAACKYIGKLHNDKFIPEIVKVLKDDSAANIHSACADGLVTMWYDYPFHKETSAAAYKAYIDYLKKTPRSKDVPSFAAISTIKSQNEKEFGNWKAKATYFKPTEIVAVMSDIAKDDNASFITRSTAMQIITKYGMKADLLALKPAIEASKDKNLLMKTLEKEISMAK